MNEDDGRTLVCNLSEAEKAKRRPKAEALFRDRLDSYRKTDDGYAFRFEPEDDVLERIFEFVDAERQCCPFFRFEVTVTPDGGPLELVIGGSEQIQSFLEEQMIPEVDTGGVGEPPA